MNTRHTPGPWQTDTVECTDHKYYQPIMSILKASDKTDENTIALVVGNWEHQWTDEHRANARLIAAAPDMELACRAALVWANTPGEHGGNPYCKDFVKLAMIALNKIDGRPPAEWTKIQEAE